MAADYRPPITAGTQAAINAEASTRASADTALAGTVTAEAVARANADSAEATARANAITAAITGLALSSDLSAETTARIAADTTLTTAVGLKASSAALASETSSRASADTALDGRLSTVESSSGKPVGGTGLTGATAATRYVGATASGGPASGTFLKGDFVVDQTGTFYICTAAGSPGTWAQAGGGLQTLVYASGAYPARPVGLAAGSARYVGPIQPTTWLEGDEWVDNS